MERLLHHIADQMSDVVKRQPARHDRRMPVRDGVQKPFESFHHAVSLRAVALPVIARGVLRDRDVMQWIEIPDASPLVVGPDRRVRQSHAVENFLYLAARGVEKVCRSDQADHSMTSVEPRRSARRQRQMKKREHRNETDHGAKECDYPEVPILTEDRRFISSRTSACRREALANRG